MVFIDSNPLLELFKLYSIVDYEIHEFRESYLSFMGEKWQNLPFLGKTRVLVLIPKVGTDTHGQRPSDTGLVPVPMDRDQVVPVPIVSGTGTSS